MYTKILKLTRGHQALLAFLCAAIAFLGTLVFQFVFWRIPEVRFEIPVFFALSVFFYLFPIKCKSTKIAHLLNVFFAVAALLLAIYGAEMLNMENAYALFASNLKAVVFAALLLLSLTGVIFFLTKRAALSLRLSVLVLAVLSYLNHFSRVIFSTPLLPENIKNFSSFYSALQDKIAFSPILVEGTILFLCALLLAKKATFPPMDKLSLWAMRAGALFCAVAFFIAAAAPATYSVLGFVPNYINQNKSSEENGILPNFFANVSELLPAQPYGYRATAIEPLAAQYSSDSPYNTDDLADVVVIVGDGWADFTHHYDVTTTRAVMPFISSFRNRKDGFYGTVYLPSAATNTTQGEFSFLTGTSDAYQLHRNPFEPAVISQTPSVASTLSALGYQTTALFAGEKTTYNRADAYTLLGFDTFLSGRQIVGQAQEKDDNLSSDRDVYATILKKLDGAQSPQFLYAVTDATYDNGANTSALADGAAISLSSPKGDFPQADAFLARMQDSDKALQEFIYALSKRTKPTIVLAFGANLPAVDAGFSAHLAQQTKNQQEGNPLSAHQSFYILWSNMTLKKDNLSAQTSVNYLGAQLLHAASIPQTGYQKFLLASAKEYPVVTQKGFLDAQGNFVSPNATYRTDIITAQNYAQYNLLYDRAHTVSYFYRLFA